MKEYKIKISMDGKGSWLDNVFVERLWRSIKYEDIDFRAYGSVSNSENWIKSVFQLLQQSPTAF